MTQQGYDNWTRSNASGWGTATDGVNAWSTQSGAAALSISSNTGLISASGATTQVMQLGSGSSGDFYIRARFKSSSTAIVTGITLRASGSNTHYRLVLGGTGGQANLFKLVSGTQTTLHTSTFSWAANTFYWVALFAIADQLYFAVWADTATPPTDWWSVSYSDAALTSGNFGVYSKFTASGQSATFTHFYAADYLLTDDNTPSDSITGTSIPVAMTGTDSLTIDDSASTLTVEQTQTSNLSTTESISFSSFQVMQVIDQLTNTETSALALSYNDPVAQITNTELFSFSVVYYTGYGEKVLGQDTVVRSNVASGWGTATDGQTWTTVIPTGSVAGTTSVSSNEAIIVDTGNDTDMQLGSQTSKDQVVRGRVSVNNTGDIAGINARFTNSSGSINTYKLIWFSNLIHINKTVANTHTTLGQVSFTMSASTFYWMELELSGSNLIGKIWQDGTAYSGATIVQASDSSITSAGGFGAVGNTATGSSGVRFDHWYITDYKLCDLVTTSDSIAFQTVQVGVSVVEQNTVTDSIQSSIALTLPSDSVSLSDVSKTADVFIPTDALSAPTIIRTDALVSSLTDALSVVDQSLFSRPVNIVDNDVSLILSDSITFGHFQYNYIDQDVLSESLLAVMARTFPADQLTIAPPSNQSGFSTLFPIPYTDISFILFDSLVPTIVQLESTQFTEVQSVLYTVRPQENEATPVSETRQGVLVVSDVTTVGTPSDSILNGIPSTFAADQLTLSESFSHGGFYPLVDPSLFPDDFFGVVDNFTESVGITETVQFALTNNLLDARSVLYNNVIQDGPSAYYQLNEDTFKGLYQRDGQDQPNNAAHPSLLGATLEYTWAQLEPQEGNILFSIIDDDILPWGNQAKRVIIRVFTASNPVRNSTAHFSNTCTQATPQWVFNAGAPSVVGLDGAVYPVYWNDVYYAKYAAFIAALAQRYDINPHIGGIVISVGVDGTTKLESSGDTVPHTTSLWTPRGYTGQQWVDAVAWAIKTYQDNFVHTPLLLSVNNGFIVNDMVYGIDQFISLAVSLGVWLMDEGVSVGQSHNNPNWNVVPLFAMPVKGAVDGGDTLQSQLTLEINYQADYAGIWYGDVIDSNSDLLKATAADATQKYFTDSASGQYKMPAYDGVYPTAHIQTGDYYNGAQQFDGLTGYGLISAAPQSATTGWTLKASIFPTVLPTQEAIVVCNGRGGLSGFNGYALGISGGNSGGSGANFCAYFPDLGWFDSGYTFPAINEWYPLFVTYDGTTLAFYVNGVKTPNTYALGVITPPDRMSIGALWDGYTRLPVKLFIGAIDEVAVYQSVLSPSRILLLANTEIGLTDTTAGSASIMLGIDQLSVSDGASTFTHPQNINDDPLTLSDTIAFSLKSTNHYAPTIIAQDNFNRPNQSPWGIANDGNTWQNLTGSSSNFSISSNQGKVTGTTAAIVVVLGGSGAQEEGLVRVQASATGQTFGLMLRVQDATNYYRARFNGTQFGIVKSVGGTVTDLLNTAFSYTANTAYYIRFKIVGATLLAKKWADGSAEPAAWDITTTDSTYSSGRVGLYTGLTSTSNNILFDSFYIIDNPLTDFVLLQESYSFTSIPPAFLESVVLADVSTITLEAILSDDDGMLAPVEGITFTCISAPSDFLLLSPSVQLWVVGFVPVEQLAEQEVLLTPFSRTFDPETVTVFDASITTPIMAPVDQIAPFSSNAEVLAVNLPDPSTLTDASQTTVERTFSEQSTTSDQSGFTSVWLEVGTLTLAETTLYIEGAVPSESTPVVETLLLVLSVSKSSILSAPTDSIFDVLLLVPLDVLTEQESLISLGSYSIIDLAATPGAGLLASALSWLLSDSVNTVDTLTFALFLSLFDVAIPVETVLFTPNFLLSDQSTILDALSDVLAVFISDAVQPSDSAQSIVNQQQSDVLNPADTFFEAAQSLTPENILALESIFVALAQFWTTLTSTLVENTLTAVTQRQSDALTSLENVFDALAQNWTDSVPPAESTLDTIVQMASDPLLPSESTTETVIAFFTSDLALSSDFQFEVVAQSFTDAATATESVLTTVSQQRTDPLAPSDAVAEVVIFLPANTATEQETVQEALVITFPADALAANDGILAPHSNSFTGWLDLLAMTENVTYAQIFIPLESQSEIESSTFSESSTIQGSAQTMQEVLSAFEVYAVLEAQGLVDLIKSTEQIGESTQFTLVEQNALSIGFTPFEAQGVVEIPLYSEVFVPSELFPITDVSTLLLRQTSIVVALTQTEQSTLTGTLRPVLQLMEEEVLQEALAAAFFETSPVSDIAPSIGYRLPADTLVCNDNLNSSSALFENVVGRLRIGTASGLLRSGTVIGRLRNGHINGVIP
jgi:hypothetical protein